MKLYCCECCSEVDATLVTGEDIYPHRQDLYDLPFWRCETCLNYVGCHHKTKDRTRPLGVIPTPEIRELRKQIHQIIDPIWRGQLKTRKAVYSTISDAIGHKFHSANIRTVGEGKKTLEVCENLFALGN